MSDDFEMINMYFPIVLTITVLIEVWVLWNCLYMMRNASLFIVSLIS